jgi:hypothetical protein
LKSCRGQVRNAGRHEPERHLTSFIPTWDDRNSKQLYDVTMFVLIEFFNVHRHSTKSRQTRMPGSDLCNILVRIV